MASGLVHKGDNDQNDNRLVLLKPRRTGGNQLSLEVTHLKTGNRLAQQPNEFFSPDHAVFIEMFTKEAQTTGMDIYTFTKKNCVYQTGYMKVKKCPDTPGTRGIDCTETKPKLSAVPWKRNTCPNHQSNSLLVVNSMSNPPCGVTGKPHLPFVMHVCNAIRKGKTKVPTLLSLHPFPGPGVRSQAATPTHVFARDLI